MRLVQRISVKQLLVVILLLVALCAPEIFATYYPVGGMLVVTSKFVAHPYTFPNGGRTLFPAYRLLALYGTPDTSALGVLGEQSAAAAARRVQSLARRYQRLTSEHVLPTFEIIATVAAASPTANGDYSYPISQATLHQWILTARKNGIYVVLDLQSGRSSFLKQAKQLAPLLSEPNVGLALDPEWRLKPHELPLEQIGSVSISEVNSTAAWLAHFTHERGLPQKLFLLHEFRLDSLPGRQHLDTSHAELAYAIQMDGQGSQSAKLATWRAIRARAPRNVHFGWKNFYDEDHPLRTPQATMKLSPQPWYVSYQ